MSAEADMVWLNTVHVWSPSLQWLKNTQTFKVGMSDNRPIIADDTL